MTAKSAASLELDLVLPLGAIANQLMRIEADLRFLNMRAVACFKDTDGAGVRSQIRARLDKITEAIDLIRELTVDLHNDLEPVSRPKEVGPSGAYASREARPNRDD